ncbi:MAG TPA: gluconeogenesis factor YvcK family protein [Thermomicrobiales bacterium]|nr:gluconeogenesis factor YvcK family protein [Thermomicrobiales bacterium]
MKLRTWLRPGMLVKRWILVLFGGLVMTSLAMAMGLAWIYRNYDFPSSTATIVQTVTLQFIPHPYREVLVIAVGIGFVLVGFFQLSRSLLSPFLDQRPGSPALAEIIASHRFGVIDPELRIVTIGGGTGLSTLLRGLKQHNLAITAIVTVGDDGGSSGRLRSEFNMPSPGDIRNCLVALADSETLLGELFQYRFEAEDSSLHGHSFGNLFITAMTKVSGSFEQAIIESSRVLNIRGQVLPSSLEDIVVSARMVDGSVVRGESQIPLARSTIENVFIEPHGADAYDPAIVAILSADLIVLGPGSLYTSVLPNLLVEGIAHALRFAPGAKVYVCNVATQPGETDGYRVIHHLRALERHVPNIPIDHVLVNSNLKPAETRIKPEWQVSAVVLDGLFEFDERLSLVERDIVNPEFPLRHDPDKLAEVLLTLGRGHRAALVDKPIPHPRQHASLVPRTSIAGKSVPAIRVGSGTRGRD